MSVCVVRGDDDSSSCRLSDSATGVPFCTTVPQNQFWSTLVQNIESLIENNIPEHEYEMLEEEFIKPISDLTTGKLRVNKKKNRYLNILPYDTTRVKLTPTEGQEGSDYINANFVGARKEYIASQAPVPEVIEDFWRMVFENSVSIIVMLTKDYEGPKLKAHQYWPDNGETQYGVFTVSLLMEEDCNDFIVREFLVTGPGGKEIRTTQYQYMTWTDHSVPDSSAAVIEVMSHIDSRLDEENKENNKISPVIVHCSAGIGRTGAFIALHSKLADLKRAHDLVDENGNCEIPSVSLLDTLRDLRNQRHGMITQSVQYEFCYLTLLEELQKLANHETSHSA